MFNKNLELNSTIHKGLVTQIECQLYLTKMGYDISLPISGDCIYDMILDVKGRLVRIQVKKCKIMKRGISISTYSTHYNGKSNWRVKYTPKDVDYYATYYNNQCYLIPILKETSAITLQFEDKPINNYNYKFIDNYTAEKQIEKMICGDIETEKEIKILQYDLNNNLLNEFNSCNEAAKYLGVKDISHLYQAMNNDRKTAYGYVWKKG